MSRLKYSFRFILATAAISLPGLGEAATVTVINDDPAGVGFNDTTARSPVGGNPGDTLGEQRLFAFEYAANLLGEKVGSSVEIRVNASFGPLTCNSNTATLGRAGPQISVADFGAGQSDTFYAIALANALAGEDLKPPGTTPETDIGAEFNGDIDNNDDCLQGVNWYYGVDGNAPPNTVEFLATVTHELIHGLGFISFVNTTTGTFPDDIPSAFDRFVFDLDLGEFWPAITDSQRLDSVTNDGNVVFDGPVTTSNGAPSLSNGVNGGRIQIFAPSPVQGGSSIAHWDSDLSPNALMEPADTGDVNANNGIGLSACLLSDIGWNLIGGTSCPDNSTFTAEPMLAVSPDPLDFGTIDAGTSDTRTVTASNSGNADLTIDNIVAPGTPFSIASQTCSQGGVLAPGADCGITIEFAPDTSGNFSDSLNIASDGGNDSVALTGSADPPPAPQVDVSPTSLSFGERTVGSTTTGSLSVSNSGDADLDIGSIGGLAAPFSIAPGGDSCSGQTLPPGQDCNVSIRFQPSTAGSFNDSVTIPSNDTTASVNVSGSAVAESNDPQLSVSPATLDFGDVNVNNNSTLTVTLNNSGSADLTISNIITPDAPFSIASQTCTEGATLTPGNSCGITVSFAPTQIGSASDTLRVETNGGSDDIALTGNGTAEPAPVITVDPESIDFGSITIGDSSQQPVTVTNDGDAELSLGTISAPSDPFTRPAGDDDCSGATLGAGEQCQFTLGFAPSASGSFNGNVTVPSNDSDITVALSGSGQEPATPAIDVSPMAIDFGDTGVGSTASRLIDVRNNGSTSLQIGSVDMPTGPFAITEQDCANRSLAVATSCSITVQFAPQTTGSVSQNFGIASNDPDDPEVTVSLVGSGVADGDADGVADNTENNAPNGGDGNDDGVPDSTQAEVASLPGVRGGYVTLATDTGAITNIRAEEAPNRIELPDSVTFDNGFFAFDITGLTPGASATVTLFLPDTPDAYYKYPAGGTGSTPAVRFDFDEASGTGAQIDGNKVTLNLVDGGRGDADMTANGVISDPGGPGFNAETGGGNAGGGGGGGCTLSTGTENRADPTLILLMLLAAAWLRRSPRRRIAPASH